MKNRKPPAPKNSRYAAVTRRTMLKRSVGTGLFLSLPGLACSASNDAEVFAGDSAASVPSTSTATPSEASVVSEAPEPTQPVATEPEPLSSAGGFSAGDEMVVNFTYTQGAGGKSLNPYIAVWIEDTDGQLVRTIELWFEQSQKGPRWLPDLRRWYSIDQSRIGAGGIDQTDLISGATRLPGAYSLVWDGLDDQGTFVGDRDLVLCIESHRERGPYSLICEPLSLSGDSPTQSLADDGELSSASLELRA